MTELPPYIEIKLIRHGSKPVILWVSRHPPIKVELDTLVRKYPDAKIYKVSGKIPNAEWLLKYVIQPLKADIIIPVLPLTMIARIADLGKTEGYITLWAEMEQVKVLDHEPIPLKDYDPDTEVWIKGYENTYKIMRFKQFLKIKEVKLVTEPWE